MEKKSVYYYDQIPIENLIINVDNARNINPDEIIDETSAIKELFKSKKHENREKYMIDLGKDIALSGLNPNEFTTVSPLIGDKDKYVVLDGNRRMTCIKLMTIYKNRLESFGLSKKVISTFSKFNFSLEKINCVVYLDESLADPLLEKLHTSGPGVGQVPWDSQAKDKHKAKLGEFTHKHAILELLKFSSYTPSEIMAQLDKPKWFSKLNRFANNVYINFFGIYFNEDHNIRMVLEEAEVIKGLCQLITDLQNTDASIIAQTKKDRHDYLYVKFPKDKIPNPTRRNKNIVIFNVSKRVMEVYENKDNNNEINIESAETTNHSESTNSFDIEQFKTTDKNINGNDNNKEEKNEINIYSTTPNSDNKKAKQFSLIPENSYIDIKDTRTRELFEELKKVSAYLYKNTVAVAFRSLIEFSVDCFLISRNGKSASYPDNPNIKLVEKIEKAYSQLESLYDNNTLKQKMPAIQFEIKHYRDKKGLDTIQILNLCVHHSNYYPDFEQLKTMYKNVEPFLKLIWESIN